MTGRPSHKPSKEGRELVKLHAVVGTKHENIARIIGVSHKTLIKHYRDELDLGKDEANSVIGGALFNKAKNGDTQAQIFWMKTQARWRTVEDHNHVSEDGSMTPRPTTIIVKAPDGSDN